MKRSLPFVAAALAATACADTPTETTSRGLPQSARLSVAGLADTAGAGAAVTFDSTGLESMRVRVIPALPDRDFAGEVTSGVDALKAALDGGDLVAARATLAALRARVDEYALAPQHDTSIGDVGAIAVYLAGASRVLSGDAAPATQP
jgi:hypothetical protein